VTGLLLMNRLGYSYTSEWFYWVIGLLIFIGLCWVPVLRIQYRLRDIAGSSLDNPEIHPEFKRLVRLWTALGVAAFSAIIVMFWMMVFKPYSVI